MSNEIEKTLGDKNKFEQDFSNEIDSNVQDSKEKTREILKLSLDKNIDFTYND
jgi:hypothetical protein